MSEEPPSTEKLPERSDAPPRTWKPSARGDLVFRRVGEDWVLFDAQGQRLHVLNLAAALVWSYCTGEYTVERIEAEVREAYEGVEDPGVVEALTTFRGAGLLEE
ncbi:MAG: PqqD family protein [Gemmatimonadota bacterium]